MDKVQKQIIKEELLLRDYLAADRTMLAVDRTFLAYIRTALTLFVAGVSFLKFFETLLIHTMGWSFIITGVAIIIFGMRRRIAVTKLINKQKISPQLETDPILTTLTSFNVTSGLKKVFNYIFRFLTLKLK